MMTTRQPEILIEGSNDAVTWQASGVPFKPGNVYHAPPVVTPGQPRLDWQMWFARWELMRITAGL